ncbi:MAG: NAD-dependent epimerase/dehydratase family protein [Bacteroidota bacterium]
MMASGILITGASGLLGTALISRLSETQDPIIALYHSQHPKQAESSPSNIRWVKCDILDVDHLTELMQECDRVYHCAGLVSFNPKRRNDLLRINVEGTTNVVNAALASGVRKLVHVSSVAALGRKRDGQTVVEQVKWDDAANPSFYGWTKYRAELEVWRGIAEGLEAVIVNPVIILGKGDWKTGSSAMFRNAYREFPWYTEGVSGFVDAEDVAEAMRRLMESPISSERFILSSENRSYRSVFSDMALCFGKQPPHRKVRPWMAALVWRWERLKSIFTGEEPLLTKETAETAQQKVNFDTTKIVTALPGFAFKPVKQTIAETCDYYIKHL